MENATDALIMAGSVLLLIIALSVSIYSFTALKSQVQEITSAEEQLQYETTTDASGNTEYINFIQGDEDVRVVGTDAIISSLRRMRKEFFTVYIADEDFASELQTPASGSKYYDFKKLWVKLGKTQEYIKQNNNPETINRLQANKYVLKLSMADQALIFYDNSKQKLNDDLVYLIYSKTYGKKYSEYIGVYKEKLPEHVSDANKGKENKIITFVRTN